MKLLFLVNSGAEGAAAHRAQAFAQYLPSDWNVSLLYREGGKQAALRAFLKEAQRQRPDIVYVMDCAYSGVLAGVLSRTRLIVDTGDLSYELSRSAQLQRGLNLALVRGIEQLGMRRSDAVVVRGTFHKELLETEWHLPSERVAFVPDGVHCDSLLQCDGTTVRVRSPSQPRVAHQGLLGQRFDADCGTSRRITFHHRLVGVVHRQA